jgi:diguanylate cyclase (GGDEF)-like protein
MHIPRLHSYTKAIFGAYAIFTLGLLVTCLLIIKEVNDVLKASEDLYIHPFAVSNAALEAKISIASIRDGLTFGVLSGDKSMVNEAYRNEAFQNERFRKNLAVVEANYLGDPGQVAEAKRLYSAWKTVRGHILDTASEGDFASARNMILDTGTPAYTELRLTLDAITEVARDKAASLIAEARLQSARASAIVYGTIFMGFAASFVSGLFVVRHVQRIVRSNEDILVYKANHDELTGLPNRSLFFDRLSQALKFAQRAKTPVGVIYIDLDGFKAVNDTLGHEAGDELLVLAARRLSSALRRSDTIARLGGDEFVVIIVGANSRGEIEQVAAKLADRLNAPARIKGGEVLVRGSFGTAAFPYDGGEVATLMAKADAAMYRDKSRAQKDPASYLKIVA